MEAVDAAAAVGEKDYTKYIKSASVKSAAILKREDFTALKTIMPQTKIISRHHKQTHTKDIYQYQTRANSLPRFTALMDR